MFLAVGDTLWAYFHQKSLSGNASLSPASSFPTVAPLPVSTQIPPVAPLAPFLPLPRLSTLLSNDSAHLRLPRSPVSTSAPLATDILRNHPQPCFYLWQTKATRLSICFWKAGLWRKQGYRRFLWHIHDLVMEVTMCCKPTILVYVCIWVYSGQSCIWVLNVGAVRCAQMYYCKDRQRLVGVMANFYSTTQRVNFGCILFSNEPVFCTPKFLNCWMGPGQASTQDQSVQALMIHLCELKKCVGTLQWAEPQSTLRQKIPTRIGCIHTRGWVVFTLG